MKKLLFWILSLTWGLPMTLTGAISKDVVAQGKEAMCSGFVSTVANTQVTGSYPLFFIKRSTSDEYSVSYSADNTTSLTQVIIASYATITDNITEV